MPPRTRKSLITEPNSEVVETGAEYRIVARTAEAAEYEVAPGAFTNPAEADSVIHQDRRRYRDEVEHGRAQFPEYRIETRTVTRSAWTDVAVK